VIIDYPVKNDFLEKP